MPQLVPAPLRCGNLSRNSSRNLSRIRYRTFAMCFFRSHIDLIAIVRLGCTLDALSETDTRWPAHANSFRVARPHWRTLPTSWSNRPRPCGANLYGAGIAWLRRVKQTLDRGPGSHGIGKPGWELMECSLNAPPHLRPASARWKSIPAWTR